MSTARPRRLFCATNVFSASPKSVTPAGSSSRRKRNTLKMRALPRVCGMRSMTLSLVETMLDAIEVREPDVRERRGDTASRI